MRIYPVVSLFALSAMAQTHSPDRTNPATIPPAVTDPMAADAQVPPSPPTPPRTSAPTPPLAPPPPAAQTPPPPLPTPISAPRAAASVAPAQTYAASDDVVALPTFEVVTDKDIGYIAVDSLAGGRTSMPIKLTPSAMSSITRTFMDDVVITDMRQALQWTLNVIPSDLQAGKGSPFNSWDYNFRGAGQSIQGGAGPVRNYFTFYQVADAYNVERIEFDRGPNSILFGVGTIGGLLNIYTKVPRLDKNFVTPEFMVDNYGSLRLTLDGNWRLPNNVAMRVNALYQSKRGWRENDVNNQAAVDIGLLWKASETTQLHVDLEGGKSKNTILQSSLAEATSLWDKTTVADTATTVIPSGTQGVQQESGFSSAQYWVYTPSLAGAGVMDFSKAYRTTGNFMPLAPYSGFYGGTLLNGAGQPYPNGGQPPVMPGRDYTVGTGISRPEYANITVTLDQKIMENFDGELALYHYRDNTTATNYENVGFWAIDINRQLPSGAANPNFGNTFGDFFLSKQTQERRVTEGRAQLNYQLAVGPLKQRFSVAGGIQEVTWEADQYLAQYTNNPATAGQTYANSWPQNMVWSRLYADQPNIAFSTPSSIGGKNVSYNPPGTDWLNFDENHRLSNIAAVSHSRLWDDALSVLAGVRYDDYTYHKAQHWSGAKTHMAAHDTTYAIGAIYYIHGVDWLGVFANYSTNFDPLQPGLSNQLDGSAMSAATGKGYDIGIRISTKDGKYYASASYYEGKSEGRASNTNLGFSAYWQNYFKALQQAPDLSRTTLNYSDTESLKIHGYEFEVTANPLPSLRVQASLALPEAEYETANPGQRAYYAQQVAGWQQAVTTGLASGNAEAASAANSLQGQLTNGANTLTSTEAGRPQVNLVDYTANVFANYTFLDGILKGFSAGAGATFLGKQYLTTIRNQKWYGDSRQSVSLVFAYTTKLVFNKETRIALNIDNVLNDRDAVITGYDGGWRYANGSPAPNGYYQPMPITFRLSMRIMF